MHRLKSKIYQFAMSNSSSICQTERTQFSVISDSNSTFTAFIAAKYIASIEELIASKLGLVAEDITVIEKDIKKNKINNLYK